MLPAALLTELPAAIRNDSFALMTMHPWMVSGAHCTAARTLRPSPRLPSSTTLHHHPPPPPLPLPPPPQFVASGFSGFFVNITSFLLVKRTSSMTLKTMTMARNGGLVMVSALLMGETITGLEAFGYTGLLFFFSMYTVVKAQEAANK